MTYEALLNEAQLEGLTVKEKNLIYNNGRIKGGRIAIRKGIDTSTEKSCILAEELGHYYTSTGDILDQSKTENRKQELRARMWAFNKQIGLIGIIDAYKHGCQNAFEISEYLEVTEEFLKDALRQYRNKYGVYKTIDNYIIFFEPYLAVMEKRD